MRSIKNVLILREIQLAHPVFNAFTVAAIVLALFGILSLTDAVLTIALSYFATRAIVVP
ncbi:MAG: hypothetical protein V1811_03105 [Candidatus Micrarchaeota archaeon]